MIPAGKPIARLLLLSMPLCGGCNMLSAEQQASLAQVQAEVAALQLQSSSTEAGLSQLQGEQATHQEALTASLDEISQRLGRLPRDLRALCPSNAAPLPASCPEPTTQVIVKDSGKMVVGELERVWLDPPGVQIVARIDTGASSSSVHAGKLVEFERDGEDWVRFEWQLKDQSVSIERPVERYVRVVQQADPKGTRRPVVNLRLRMGDIEDSYDFTLADRAHLEYQIILGRNFLTNTALVDVGQQFVQPAYSPKPAIESTTQIQ